MEQAIHPSFLADRIFYFLEDFPLGLPGASFFSDLEAVNDAVRDLVMGGLAVFLAAGEEWAATDFLLRGGERVESNPGEVDLDLLLLASEVSSTSFLAMGLPGVFLADLGELEAGVLAGFLVFRVISSEGTSTIPSNSGGE